MDYSRLAIKNNNLQISNSKMVQKIIFNHHFRMVGKLEFSNHELMKVLSWVTHIDKLLKIINK